MRESANERKRFIVRKVGIRQFTATLRHSSAACSSNWTGFLAFSRWSWEKCYICSLVNCTWATGSMRLLPAMASRPSYVTAVWSIWMWESLGMEDVYKRQV